MMNINVAYYRKKDWKRFTEIIDDRESMHKSWEEWHKAFLKTVNFLTLQGFKVTKVEVDLDKLIDYCAVRGIKNDGKARSKFTQEF